MIQRLIALALIRLHAEIAARMPGAEQDSDLTPGERAAERVANALGSWRFVIIQNAIVFAWIAFNVIALFGFRADPYPFILLNLLFSWQASNTGPILQMTGNAAAKRDRKLWEMMAKVLQHVEGIAQADHVEHGRLLRALAEHITCDGHTHVGSAPEPSEAPAQPPAAAA